MSAKANREANMPAHRPRNPGQTLIANATWGGGYSVALFFCRGRVLTAEIHLHPAPLSYEANVRFRRQWRTPLPDLPAAVLQRERGPAGDLPRVKAVADALGKAYEIVFLNDGSTDDTLAQMLQLAQRDPALVIVNLSRKHGHQLALSAGLHYCAGERVLILDADLQDPPELLPQMLALIGHYRALRGTRPRISAGAAAVPSGGRLPGRKRGIEWRLHHQP